MTLGLPAVFQFLGLKFSLFLHFLISLIIFVFEFSPPSSLFTFATTPTLFQSLLCESSFPVCVAYFEGTFFFPPLYFFFFITCLYISDLSLLLFSFFFLFLFFFFVSPLFALWVFRIRTLPPPFSLGFHG